MFEGVFAIIKSKKYINIYIFFLSSTRKPSFISWQIEKSEPPTAKSVMHDKFQIFGSKGSVSFGTDMHEKRNKNQSRNIGKLIRTNK